MLTILWIIFLAVLSSAKIALQSAIAKNELHGTGDRILFNGIIFAAAALCFLPFGISSLTPLSAVYGIFLGLGSICFQLCYVQAMATGPVSLTVMLINFSLLIPTVASVFLFDEPMTLLNFVGILLILISFTVTVRPESGKRINLKWVIFVMLTTFTNGALSILQKYFSHSPDAGHTAGFVLSAYMVAAVGSVVLLFPYMRKSYSGVRPACTRRMLLFGIPAGIVLGVFQQLYTNSIGAISGVLLFPLMNSMIAIISTLFGMVVLRENLTKRQALGCIIGIAAIVIMSL